MRRIQRTAMIWLLAPVLAACGSSKGDNDNDAGTGECQLTGDVFEAGDPDGHSDPFGARAAGEARASRVAEVSQIVQPADARQQVQVSDFLLINDQIAVYIEGVGLSDGYGRFGGEILAIDKVGDDGRPLGLSYYGETLMGLSKEMILPESVTVLADGSDGGAAIVRVKGRLEPIPFLTGPFEVLFSGEYGFDAVYDYVLEPGSAKLTIRLGVVNNTDRTADVMTNELYGFFHYSRSSMVTSQEGYADPGVGIDWAGFDSGAWNFAWRSPHGGLAFALYQSGVSVFFGPGFEVDPCSVLERDHSEIIAGGPHLDGLREAIRAEDGETPWREIQGTVQDSLGNPVADAWVHELATDDTYLSRTKTSASGQFTLHAPAEAVRLVPQVRGYPAHTGTEVDANTSTAALAFAPHGVIHITATDASTLQSVPVRIQVIPTVPQPATPESYGVLDAARGRLHQHFSTTGDASLIVPPGEHRIIVSRGYEYEIHDATALVAAGGTVLVDAPLIRSVDTTGVMCADFHFHTLYSADSRDPVEYKVAGAVADGLDIPVFSDHEWVTDGHAAVVALGLENQAYGVSSLEMTTFEWGHFGIVPLIADPAALNNGAIDWIGLTPGETFEIIRARPEDPAIIVNHPREMSVGGFFNATDWDPETGEGNRLYDDDFDSLEVFNNSTFEANREDSVADWFALLELGRTMVVTGSSDNHHLRTGPVGYPRTCMYFGHDDVTLLTPSIVRDALLSGAAVVSGGIFISVAGPAGERPGETITTSAATVSLTVTVQAPSWVGVDSLEVIVNSVTTETIPLTSPGPGPGQRYELTVEIPVDQSRSRNWAVLHVKGEGDLTPIHPGKEPFAASNPIYIEPQ